MSRSGLGDLEYLRRGDSDCPEGHNSDGELHPENECERVKGISKSQEEILINVVERVTP